MKILIVDDEALARTRLRELLRDSDSGHTMLEAGNGLMALELAQRESPDVVLLDIRMPGMGGLEAAIHLARLPNPPAIIFTTAYDEHALQAFEASAVDYLLKPVRAERLSNALARARMLRSAQVAELRRLQPDARQRTHFSIRSRDGLLLVPVDEVAYLRADQKYVAAAWREREVLVDEPLKALEDEFADLFLRIHRNALVARDHILGLERQRDGTMAVRLRAVEEPIPISRRHLAEVRTALKGIAG
ncbi:MAG: DNA-binding response regulator [Gammaproteobacteria bacterium RIFCSPLOWO2_02_FULL_61_13]|nr:MAG: DNA-binding response regulator [Gammaproteobacteria bacterium RIFCSPLOWO2_02_FULL_61_13]